MSNLLIGTPIYSDTGVLQTPAYNGGSWNSTLVLNNVKDRNLFRVARSRSIEPCDTRFRCDLGQDRAVRVVGISQTPAARLSTVANVRFLGVPAAMLFDLEAGDDGATNITGWAYSRATANGYRGTYTDSGGTFRGDSAENRCLRSEDFTNATWVKTSVTATGDTIADPNGVVDADTLTSTGANGTVVQDLGTLPSQAYTFSIYLKRKTGVGNVQLCLDSATWVTQTITSTAWTRCSVTQTLANPDACIRIVTNTDAVYAWGAQVNVGSVADAQYLSTTTATKTTIRDADFIGGNRHILLEPASTNLVIQSDALATGWTAAGTCSAANTAGSAAGRSFSRITNPNGGTLLRSVTLTGNAVKAVSFIVHIDGLTGSSGWAYVLLRDTTASVNRCSIKYTISAAGVVTAVAIAGTLLGVEALADGAYRIHAVSTSCTAANSHAVYANDTGGDATLTSVLMTGVQVEDNTYPTSLIPTTTATVTRPVDALSVSSVATSGTLYVKYFDLATRAYVESTTAYTGGAAITFTTGRAYFAVRIALGTQSQATMQAIVYDSGWLDAFPSTKTLEDVEGQNINVFNIPNTTGFTGRYWSCQIDDYTNSAGTVDIARFLVTGGYQPVTNAQAGVQIGVETDSVRSVGDSGVAVYLERPKRRFAKWTLPEVPESEAFPSNLNLQRLVGTTRQVVIIIDPGATTYFSDQSFLGVLRNLSPLEYAVSPRFTIPYEAVEEL